MNERYFGSYSMHTEITWIDEGPLSIHIQGKGNWVGYYFGDIGKWKLFAGTILVNMDLFARPVPLNNFILLKMAVSSHVANEDGRISTSMSCTW